MAGGVVAALSAQGLVIPVGGQDGDLAAINRVARGSQTVSVWKDARNLGKAAGEIASALASGTAMSDIEGASMFDGGEKGIAINAILMEPTPFNTLIILVLQSTVVTLPKLKLAKAQLPA